MLTYLCYLVVKLFSNILHIWCTSGPFLVGLFNRTFVLLILQILSNGRGKTNVWNILLLWFLLGNKNFNVCLLCLERFINCGRSGRSRSIKSLHLTWIIPLCLWDWRGISLYGMYDITLRGIHIPWCEYDSHLVSHLLPSILMYVVKYQPEFMQQSYLSLFPLENVKENAGADYCFHCFCYGYPPLVH